jgi:hypothetical protein
MPDLLPADFGTETVQPPLVVLREQGEHLARRTGGLVVARVATLKNQNNSGELVHRFILEVPSLDEYAYTLFTVIHPLVLYPLRFQSEALPEGSFDTRADNPSQFEAVLRGFFAQPAVSKIVASLKAQAAATVGAEANR